MNQCSKCKQIFEDEVVFCPYCGEKLEELIEEKQAEYTCVECGEIIDEECDFCPYCGAAQYDEEEFEEQEDTEMEDTEMEDTEMEDSEILLSSDDLKKLKLRKWIGIVASAFLIVYPIIIHGFSFGWIWYVLLFVVFFLMLTFYSITETTKDALDSIDGLFTILFIIWLVMYLWGPANSDYSY